MGSCKRALCSSHMMKRYGLILIGLCVLAGQANAQVAIATARELSMVSRGVAKSVRKGNPLYIPGKSTVGRTGLYSFQITHVLERRALSSIVKAHKTRRQLAPNTRSRLLDPAVLVGNINENLAPFTRSAPFLRTPRQTRAYLIARENRLYVRETKRLFQEKIPQLEENLPRLREGIYTHMPEDPVHFVVQAIPKQVNTIGIGEAHGFENMHKFMVRFLPELRKERPNREIFLLTEFASREKKYSAGSLDGKDAKRNEIWQAADENNIQIVGLEPKEILQDYNELSVQRGENAYVIVSVQGKPMELAFAGSANAIQWRNEIFLQTIQEHQAQHPDAIFIIYTGSTHINTRAPFAVTLPLDPKKTFVINLLPTRMQVKQRFPQYSGQDTRNVWDPLGDELEGKESFNYPLLYWKDPELARIAGANMYLRVGSISFK